MEAVDVSSAWKCDSMGDLRATRRATLRAAVGFELGSGCGDAIGRVAAVGMFLQLGCKFLLAGDRIVSASDKIDPLEPHDKIGNSPNKRNWTT